MSRIGKLAIGWQEFNPATKNGAVTFTYPNNTSFLPTDMTVDGSGNVYAVDGGNALVIEFNASGAPIAQFGKGILSQPEGITNDGAGHFFVSGGFAPIYGF